MSNTPEGTIEEQEMSNTPEGTIEEREMSNTPEGTIKRLEMSITPEGTVKIIGVRLEKREIRFEGQSIQVLSTSTKKRRNNKPKKLF